MIRKLVGKLFWGSVWAVAIFSSFYVYYYKYPDVRAKVDARLPVAKEIHATIVSALHLSDPAAPAPSPAPESVVQIIQSGSAAPGATPAPPEAVATPAATPVAVATPVPAPDTVDLTELARTKSEWPKLVSLKKVVQFPAVMDGRVIGNVQAPVGSQVELILIKDGKAGVEFQGGGAMVNVGDTDLIERVKAGHHASVK